jgi:hypothetical protein
MRFLFLIQGEGRGHLTQALSFAGILRSEGHQLCGVVVGKSPRRNLPEFFIQKIGVEVTAVESPNFETDGLESIVTRAPTHEPYPYHNKGVDIDISLEAGQPPPNPGAVPVPAGFEFTRKA